MSSPIVNPTRALHRVRVEDIEEVAPAHFQMKLLGPDLARNVLPGQFVHILTAPNPETWSFDPLLRRAFSVMSVNSDRTSIELLFRVGGRGTTVLSKAHKGDEIDLIGPLGQPFDLSPFGLRRPKSETFHVKHTGPTAILVGGGVGVPPLVFLGQYLSSIGIESHAIIGARKSTEVVGSASLGEVCAQVSITTEDGSLEHRGRVTDLLPTRIEELTGHEQERETKPVVYSCGPLQMLRAVARVCAEAGVRCQVSLEENMPCGIGVCNGCVVRARQPFANTNAGELEELSVNEEIGNEWTPYRAYRRVCVEGPACWADEIDWDGEG